MNNAYKIRVNRATYVPIPIEPIPALTTGSGYAVAVMLDNGIVRGIYDKDYRRMKLDIITDKYRLMATSESRQFPTDYQFLHSSSIVCLVPHTHCDPWQSY